MAGGGSQPAGGVIGSMAAMAPAELAYYSALIRLSRLNEAGFSVVMARHIGAA